MRIKGAIHVHSAFSHDGALPVAELAALYRRNNYQFIAITEHAEDLGGGEIERLREQCASHSSDRFCIIPGVEFSFSAFHILGIGLLTAQSPPDGIAAVRIIHGGGGIAVLAHPKRFGWKCPVEVLRAVDAVEIWNVGYDGKFLPPAAALARFAAWRKLNPRLRGMAGHDLHRKESFYDAAVEVDAPALLPGAILSSLRQGRFEIRSRFFRAGPQGRVSPAVAALTRMMSEPLRQARRVRSAALGWFA